MSEALLGVIIGGVIASITPIIIAINEQRKWKKESRIEYLKSKKEKLEKAFHESFEKITEGASRGRYNIYTISDFNFIFPAKVSEEFEKFMALRTDDANIKRGQLYAIARSMKQELAEIEKKIECEIS